MGSKSSRNRQSRGWTVWLDRSAKNWRVRWKGKYGGAQRIFVYKDDAADFAREKRRDFQRLDAGLPAAHRIGGMTVAQWWESYSTRKRLDHPETFRRFDTPAISPFVEKHGQIVLAAIGEDAVLNYRRELSAKYSGDTPLMYYRQVCAFFNAAVRAGHLLASPAKNIKKPNSGGGGGRPLLDVELFALMAVAPEPLYRAAVFSMNTMLRINEVCAFDWSWVEDVEPLGWMLRIPAQARKTRANVVADCIWPINDAARAVMWERRERGRVFDYPASTIQHQITAARRAAKLPEDVTFHCFRHTGLTRYLAAGGHIEDPIKCHVWEDWRSILRYVTPSPATLFRRANAVKYSLSAPTRLLNREGRSPEDSRKRPTEG